MEDREIDSAYIESRIDDWIKRLNHLFSEIEQWRKEIPFETEASMGEMFQKNEELMVKLNVSPKQVPNYAVRYKTNTLSFSPEDLWTIGANGRLNVTTNKKQNILADLEGKNGNPSRWVIVTPSERQVHIDFDKDVFIRLLTD